MGERNVERLLVGLTAVFLLAGCAASASPTPVLATPTPVAVRSAPAATLAPVPTVTATPTPATTPTPTPSRIPTAGGPDTWHRVDGGVLAYSLALPPGSWLMTSVPKDGGQDQ